MRVVCFASTMLNENQLQNWGCPGPATSYENKENCWQSNFGSSSSWSPELFVMLYDNCMGTVTHPGIIVLSLNNNFGAFVRRMCAGNLTWPWTSVRNLYNTSVCLFKCNRLTRYAVLFASNMTSIVCTVCVPIIQRLVKQHPEIWWWDDDHIYVFCTFSPILRWIFPIWLRDFAWGTLRVCDSHCTMRTFSKVRHPYDCDMAVW